MVEQFHGKEEVIGSTPIVSTSILPSLDTLETQSLPLIYLYGWMEKSHYFPRTLKASSKSKVPS